jgi:hypothetical protein
MCFIVVPDHDNLLTATEDIKCYKVGRKKTPDTFTPLYMGYFTYHKGETYKLDKPLQPESKGQWAEVHEGYHSMSDNKQVSARLLVFNSNNHNEYTAAEFTIPKGANYYYNPYTQEYVSDQIIYP